MRRKRQHSELEETEHISRARPKLPKEQAASPGCITSSPVSGDFRELPIAGKHHQSKNEMKRRAKVAAKKARKEAKHNEHDLPGSETDTRQRAGTEGNPQIVLWTPDRSKVQSILSKSEMGKLGIQLAQVKPEEPLLRTVYVNATYVFPSPGSSQCVMKSHDVGQIIVQSDQEARLLADMQSAFRFSRLENQEQRAQAKLFLRIYSAKLILALSYFP